LEVKKLKVGLCSLAKFVSYQFQLINERSEREKNRQASPIPRPSGVKEKQVKIDS